MALHCIHGGECNGCMACYSDPEPVCCEVCGAEADYLYKTKDGGDVVGCSECIKKVDPYDE